MPELPEVDTDQPATEPAALAGHYLRSFAGAVASMSDFDPFVDTLKRLVGEDPFLEGAAELTDPFKGSAAKLPNFDELDSAETVVSVACEAGNVGYLKYARRQDNEPFGAEDMHLMGSIAGFISALVVQAEKFRQQGKLEKVLQYLVNQLPLGVMCFDTHGSLMVESKSASRLLGEKGSSRLSEIVSTGSAFVKGRAQLHFEIDGKLVYSEGRLLRVEDGLEVVAFVLYDLSNYREKLLMDLEREAYRSESRHTHLTLALFEHEGEAGAIYRKLRNSAERLQLEPAKIQPIDAYTCACLFPDMRPRAVRYLLKAVVGSTESAHLSLVAYQQSIGDAPGESMIEQARAGLAPAEQALLPRLVVLDPYPAVFEALSIMTSEVCHLDQAESVEDASAMMRTGVYDGIFLDLDSFKAAQIQTLRQSAVDAGEGCKVFYCSHRQPAMAREDASLAASEIVFQKPFCADRLTECLSLQFDLA